MSTSDELGPYSKWLVAVAAAAKARPWIGRRDGHDHTILDYCIECKATDSNGPLTHKRDCPFAALDAALDAEPKE